MANQDVVNLFYQENSQSIMSDTICNMEALCVSGFKNFPLYKILEMLKVAENQYTVKKTNNAESILWDEVNDVSTRTYFLISQTYFKKPLTLGTIIQYSEKELLRFRNVGRKTVAEVKEILAKYGLKLAD